MYVVSPGRSFLLYYVTLCGRLKFSSENGVVPKTEPVPFKEPVPKTELVPSSVSGASKMILLPAPGEFSPESRVISAKTSPP